MKIDYAALTPEQKAAAIASFRATLEACKVQAMDRLERDYGTRNVASVARALQAVIPYSTSPAHAGRMARTVVAMAQTFPPTPFGSAQAQYFGAMFNR